MSVYHTHTPVLADETMELLVSDPSGIYVDATLGGGGHTLRLLERCNSDARVYGVDQDAEALKEAVELLREDARFVPVAGNFEYLETLLPPDLHGQITGFLFDFGVSTHQIREPERGFSFMNDGPLDMRMSQHTGLTAEEVVNRYSYESLRDLIFHLGEERKSREIARAIVERRPVKTTGELRSAVESVVKGPHVIKSVARVFQAIRMEVNREIEVIKAALEQSLRLLKSGGRVAAISYHSLEDRLVKNFFRSGNFEGKVEKDFYGNPLTPFRLLTKKPILPSEQEKVANSASRSAKLRVAEKLELRREASSVSRRGASSVSNRGASSVSNRESSSMSNRGASSVSNRESSSISRHELRFMSCGADKGTVAQEINGLEVTSWAL